MILPQSLQWSPDSFSCYPSSPFVPPSQYCQNPPFKKSQGLHIFPLVFEALPKLFSTYLIYAHLLPAYFRSSQTENSQLFPKCIILFHVSMTIDERFFWLECPLPPFLYLVKWHLSLKPQLKCYLSHKVEASVSISCSLLCFLSTACMCLYTLMDMFVHMCVCLSWRNTYVVLSLFVHLLISCFKV